MKPSSIALYRQDLPDGAVNEALNLKRTLAQAGTWIRGRDLTSGLGLESPRIRTLVHALRRAGFPVLSCTRRGYKLGGTSAEKQVCCAALLRRAERIIEAAEGIL